MKGLIRIIRSAKINLARSKLGYSRKRLAGQYNHAGEYRVYIIIAKIAVLQKKPFLVAIYTSKIFPVLTMLHKIIQHTFITTMTVTEGEIVLLKVKLSYGNNDIS